MKIALQVAWSSCMQALPLKIKKTGESLRGAWYLFSHDLIMCGLGPIGRQLHSLPFARDIVLLLVSAVPTSPKYQLHEV